MKKNIILFLIGCIFFVYFFANNIFAQALPRQGYIRVDQFGYLPTAKKVAIIAKPFSGFNGTETGVTPFNPTAEKVQLLKNSDNSVVFEALPTQWLNGTSTDDSRSGDRGYWFDFTSFQTPGDYKIRVKTGSATTDFVDSYVFKIDANVYVDVLKRAMNMYYYQRSNFNKNTPASNATGYAAGKTWEDGPWYNAANQSTAVEFKNGGSPKNISGGWIDAGDPNRYVDFAGEAVHDLLTSYNQFKTMWDGLNLNIPESGNGVADILDEVKYEIDWLKTMQNWNFSAKTGSGGVLNKVGIYKDPGYVSPTSNDTRALKYEGECWHSSVMAAGMFAHAALRYNQNGSSVLTADVAELTERAEKAWDHYVADPNKNRDCDNGDIEAGDGDGPSNPSNNNIGQYVEEHLAEAAVSAIYLYALTGKSKYNDFVKSNYQQTRPWKSGGGEWGVYRAHQSDAVLYYASLSNADLTVKDAIINKKKDKANVSDGKNPYKVVTGSNLYRAFSYYDGWGSNVLLSRLGSNNMDYVTLGLETDQTEDFKERAQSILNYIHGTNPVGLCYVTNMGNYGAEYSVKQMHHTWFLTDTKYDNQTDSDIGPAPGYLVSGYNAVNNPTCMKVSVNRQNYNVLVKDQPIQKKFSDRINNEGTNGYQCSDGSNFNQPWLYTEPGIYFQSAYIRLLSNFVANSNIIVDPTSVAVSPTTLNIETDLSSQVVLATVSPNNASNNAVTWSSSNTTVATVSSTGRITTLAAGTANIIATTVVGNFTAACTVTVSNAPTSAACGLVNNPGFESNFKGWLNPNGNVTISASSRTGSKAAEFDGSEGMETTNFINVVDNLEFTYNTYAKIEGSPTNAQIGIDYWSASAKLSNDVQTVTATSYTLSQLKKTPPPGTTRVKLWFYKGGAGKMFIDDICFTQSSVAVSSVAVSPATSSINVGASVQAVSVITPTDATIKTITWSSSNTAIATVNTSGLIIGTGVGSATIVATSNNSKTASISVTVTNSSCGLVINEGFENNFNQWTNKNNSCSIITAEKRSGAKAVSMNANGAGFENANLYTVTNGHIVTIAAYAYITGNPTVAQIGVDYIKTDANGSTELAEDVFNITATSYTKYGITKVPPAGTNRVRIWAYKGNNGKVFLDDFCLTTKANSCGLVTNPGFENGLTGWTNTNTVASTTTSSRTDRLAAVINNDGGFNRAANIAYSSGTINFEAYARVEGTPTNAQIGLDYLNTTTNPVTKVQKIFNVTGNTYTKYGIVETPPVGTNQILIWTYKSGGTSAKLFLDDFCLTNQVGARQAAAEIKENTLKLYPNPAKNSVTLKTNGSNYNLEVDFFTLAGLKMKSEKFSNLNGKTSVEMNVSTLPKGLYIIAIKQGSENQVFKLFKE